MISKLTDKILPEIKEWQTRHLEEVYLIVFMDAIHYSVRQDGIVIKKAVYILIGINTRREKDVLGFWLNILNEIENQRSTGYSDNISR